MPAFESGNAAAYRGVWGLGIQWASGGFQMAISEMLLAEFEQEMANTRTV